MKNIRTKASRFFSPTRDERAADNSEIDFDAGIQDVVVRKKASRSFWRKNDKQDNSLSASPSMNLIAPVAARVAGDSVHGDDFDNLPEYEDEAPDERPAVSPARRALAISSVPEHTGGSQVAKVKSKSSFAALKYKGSHLFRGGNRKSTHSPPPPPIPQIPVETPSPKVPRRSLTPSYPARISRPQLKPQLCSEPLLTRPATVPFQKRPGPAPQRPPRPESLDEETITLMRENGGRMVLSSSNRGSSSTATNSTPRSSETSSIQARLGFPSGYGTPRSCSLESPLAARFPADPSQRLPIRDSSGSLRFSRFSQYVPQGTYASDGIEKEDREVGPIEQYRRSKQGDWKLEKKIRQGRDGKAGGMLFRDKFGAFHFVADI